MTIQFARRMNNLKASEIRELLKVTERPSVISFAGGLPAPESFPLVEMKAVAIELLDEDGRQALQYSTTEGHRPLREKIAERMTVRVGAPARPEEILITTASQQGLDLSGKVFLDEGDAVICESPTYIGAISAFRAYQPRFIEAPTDDDGMIVPELERILAREDRVKLIYVVPDFQNPTGRCWSAERRREFMRVVADHGIPVIEDAPYREIRFEGESAPSLKTLDENGLVVFLSTFSKIFAPGLRIGWVAAARPVLEKYVLVKQGADLHSSTRSQMELALYLSRFDIDANLRQTCALYRRRRDAMLQAIEREFPPEVRCTRPQGGLFLWATLPGRLNARAVLVRSIQRDVAFVPGGSFFPNGGHENTMRLNFSNMPEDRIDEGVRRIGKVLRELLPAARAAEVRP
jgi:2-aminoadipate transaminase